MHRSVGKITDKNVDIFIINKICTAKSNYYNADNHIISLSCGHGRKEKFAHQRSNEPLIMLWLCSGPPYSGKIFFWPDAKLTCQPLWYAVARRHCGDMTHAFVSASCKWRMCILTNVRGQCKQWHHAYAAFKWCGSKRMHRDRVCPTRPGKWSCGLFDRPLVVGFSTGHKPRPLHVNELDFSQNKTNNYTSNTIFQNMVLVV